jgi:hypothetical protein
MNGCREGGIIMVVTAREVRFHRTVRTVVTSREPAALSPVSVQNNQRRSDVSEVVDLEVIGSVKHIV